MTTQVDESPQGGQFLSDVRHFLFFLAGLGLGLLPLILSLIGSAFFTFGTVFWSVSEIASFVLFGGVVVAAVVCLIAKPLRYVGWGLLFAVLGTLCVVGIGYSYVTEHL